MTCGVDPEQACVHHWLITFCRANGQLAEGVHVIHTGPGTHPPPSNPLHPSKAIGGLLLGGNTRAADGDGIMSNHYSSSRSDGCPFKRKKKPCGTIYHSEKEYSGKMLWLRRCAVRNGWHHFHTLKRDLNTSVVGKYQWCPVMLLFKVKKTWQELFCWYKREKLHLLCTLV